LKHLSPNPSPREGGALRTGDKVPLSPGRGGFRGRGRTTKAGNRRG